MLRSKEARHATGNRPHSRLTGNITLLYLPSGLYATHIAQIKVKCKALGRVVVTALDVAPPFGAAYFPSTGLARPPRPVPETGQGSPALPSQNESQAIYPSP